MIYIFIIIVLYLLIYQIYYSLITEGLDEETSPDPSTDSPDTSTEEKDPSTMAATSTTPSATTETSLTTPGNSGSTTDLCKNNNSYSTLSLTDRNLLFLNERINILNNNYTDLSMNFIKLENKLKNDAAQSEDDAKDLVGDKPITVTTE